MVISSVVFIDAFTLPVCHCLVLTCHVSNVPKENFSLETLKLILSYLVSLKEVDNVKLKDKR